MFKIIVNYKIIPLIVAGFLCLQTSDAQASDWHAPSAAERAETDLNEQEIALAQQVGFDPKVLQLVKESLHPHMVLGPELSSKLSLMDDQDSFTDALSAAERLKLEKVGQIYPDLMPMIKCRLESITPPSAGKLEKPAGDVVPDVGAPRTSPVPNILLSFGGDGRVDELESKLIALGYSLSNRTNRRFARFFSDKKEAEGFLADHSPLPAFFLHVIKSQDFEAVKVQPGTQSFPFHVKNQQSTDLAAYKEDSVIAAMPEGADVKQTSSNVYQFHLPERYQVTVSENLARLVKIDDRPFAQILADYNRDYGKDGVSRDKIVAQLEQWQSKYGVALLDANSTGINLYFKKLPADLDELLHEIVRFASLLRPTLDENHNAAAMRALARGLRSTNSIFLPMRSGRVKNR